MATDIEESHVIETEMIAHPWLSGQHILWLEEVARGGSPETINDII